MQGLLDLVRRDRRGDLVDPLDPVDAPGASPGPKPGLGQPATSLLAQAVTVERGRQVEHLERVPRRGAALVTVASMAGSATRSAQVASAAKSGSRPGPRSPSAKRSRSPDGTGDGYVIRIRR